MKLKYAAALILLITNSAFAIDVDFVPPSGINLSILKSDTGKTHIVSGSSVDLTVEGTKARVFFTEKGTNLTRETLMAVVYNKKDKKSGKSKKVYISAKEALDKDICSVKSAKGIYFLNSNLNEGEEYVFTFATDVNGAVTHAYLDGIISGTEILANSALTKRVKKVASLKTADLSDLDDDCSRTGGEGFSS